MAEHHFVVRHANGGPAQVQSVLGTADPKVAKALVEASGHVIDGNPEPDFAKAKARMKAINAAPQAAPVAPPRVDAAALLKTPNPTAAPAA